MTTVLTRHSACEMQNEGDSTCFAGASTFYYALSGVISDRYQTIQGGLSVKLYV